MKYASLRRIAATGRDNCGDTDLDHSPFIELHRGNLSYRYRIVELGEGVAPNPVSS
jgi:hypothetical protein